VTRDRLKLPNGKPVIREVVRHGGSVGIVPLVEPDGVLLIKQYRFAVDDQMWEIPAGTIEGGETPERCAGRELAEETGYKAESLIEADWFYTTPGFCDEIMHLFVALGCEPVGDCAHDEDEGIVRRDVFTIGQALDMVVRGEIRDAKTIIGLHVAAQRYNRT